MLFQQRRPCSTRLKSRTGRRYPTLTIDLLSACPHRQFHTLPSLLDSWAALSDSYPSTLRAMQGGSSYHFYDGLLYDPGREANSRPTVRKADTLITKPTRHSMKSDLFFSNQPPMFVNKSYNAYKYISFFDLEIFILKYFDVDFSYWLIQSVHYMYYQWIACRFSKKSFSLLV